jgi:hypothetical protein
MPPASIDLLSLALLGGVWASFLWFPLMRTARTIAYLSAATVTYLLATTAPEPWPLILRATVLASMLAFLFVFPDILSALPRGVSAFVKAYAAINRRMAAAYSEFEDSKGQQQLESALIHGAAELRDLELPPGEEWERLRDAAVTVVETRLAMLRDGTDRDASEATRFRTKRAEVHLQLRTALERSRNFWR